jgi:hypothetical protein
VAASGGWKHWAVVMPEKAFGKLNMKYVTSPR